MRLPKLILLFIATIGFALNIYAQKPTVDSGRVFSVQDLKEDFNYFRQQFENADPALYLYTSKFHFDSYFDSLSSTIVQPLTERTFYNLITLVNTRLMDGHVHIFPNTESSSYQNRHGVFLPLHVINIGPRLYIDMNNSSDRSIPEGAELISLNGEKAPDIINFLMERQIRDGYNKTYPRWILNNWFKEYFGFHYGYPSNFQVEYRTLSGQEITITVRSLTRDSIRIYQKKYYPGKQQPGDNEGISLRFDSETATAILKIKSFDNELLKETYHQDFGSTISAFFHKIRKKKSKNLILDLRDNQGGDVENGALLISHLVDSNYTIVRANFKIKNPSSGKPEERLMKSFGKSVGPQQPDENPFTGKLLILINGGSFSNSGIVSSALAYYHRGEFIGEETGGNRNIICGDAEGYKLPHTGIAFEVPTVIYEMWDMQFNEGQGTIPQFEISSGILDIISNTDLAMEKAWELIKKNP